jgi:hypothetical protein
MGSFYAYPITITSLRWLLGGLLLLLLTSTMTRAQAPAWQEALALSQTTGGSTITAIATDASGDVLMTGSFGGTVVFGNTTLSSDGDNDLFVAKWSPASGRFVWAHRAGSADYDAASAVAVSGSSVYITGSFSGDVASFGDLRLPEEAGRLFVVKLTDTGTSSRFVWAQQAVAPNSYQYMPTYALAVSGSSVYVAGSFTSSTVDFGGLTLTSAGEQDIFVAKLTDAGTTGSFTWAQQAGGRLYDYATALAVSGSNVYVAGSFSSDAGTGQPGVRFGDITVPGSGSYGTRSFVAKLTDAGQEAAFTWVEQVGTTASTTTGGNGATALAVSGSSVYMAGEFEGTAATFGATSLPNANANGTSRDGYVAKLADAGGTASFAWAQQVGGMGDDRPQALAVSGSSVYVAGQFAGSAGFGSTTLTSVGDYGMFVTKLTDTGSSASFAWAQQAEGANYGLVEALALTSAGVQVAGSIDGPTATFGSLTLTLASYGAGFLATLDGPGPVTAPPTLTGIAPGSGPAGSTVILTGTNLRGVSRISFAGTSNTLSTGFEVNSAGTQLTGVVVPGDATTGPVTVTTPAGTSNAVSFTVSTPPAPVTSAPAWQLASGLSGGSSSISASVTDASGNVYVVGDFSGTVSFGSTSLTSAGEQDVFVAKYSPATSRYLWAQRAGGTADDHAAAVAVSGTSVYVAGYFFSASAGFGSAVLTNTEEDAHNEDVFVAKLIDAGATASFSWAERAGGISNDYATGLAASGTSVYLAGHSYSPELHLGSSVALAGSPRIFVAKLTDAGSSGSFIWAQQAEGTTADGSADAIAVRGTQVYLAGSFARTASFGNFPLTSAGGKDIFVARLTDAGSSAGFTWVWQAGGSHNDFAYALAVSEGGVYVGGSFYGETSFGGTQLRSSGATDMYVAKLTDNGTAAGFAWVRQAGGAGDRTLVVALTVSGTSVYAAGGFESRTATFGATTLTNANPNGGTFDLFITRLTDAGSSASFAWAQQAGGTSDDYADGIALIGTSVYVTGLVTPAASFGNLSIATPTGTPVGFVAALGTGALAAAPSAASQQGLRVYPNPAHGTATVQQPTGTTPLPLTLLDALGRPVRRYPAPAGHEATLDLRSLPAGVYVLRQGTASQRLMVE